LIEDYILYYGSIEFIKGNMGDFEKIEDVMGKMD